MRDEPATQPTADEASEERDISLDELKAIFGGQDGSGGGDSGSGGTSGGSGKQPGT